MGFVSENSFCFKNKMSLTFRRAGLVVGVLGVIIALIYRVLVTNPAVAVAGYKLLNVFTDQYDFNHNNNQYIIGPFAPVEEENFNIRTEIISGSIPSDLHGLFLRIGPNPLKTKLHHGYHWFDGDGMIHSLRVKNGEALYSNQFIETPNHLNSKKYGGVVWFQIGELKGLVGLLKLFYTQFILAKSLSFEPLRTGTANTAITVYNHRIFLGYESDLPFEISWKDDESGRVISKGYESFGNVLNFPFTAHPKKDPIEGDNLYFHGYTADRSTHPSTVKYGKLHQMNVSSYFTLPFTDAIFSHDMLITKNYVVLFDTSIVFDEKEIFGNGSFFKMNYNKNFRIALIPKTATSAQELRWFNFNASYGVVHAFNAWEEEETNEVVIVTPLYTEFGTFTGQDLSKQALEYRTAELRLNFVTEETRIIYFNEKNEGGEFPNVHPKYVGRKSRFGYASGINRTSHHFDRIVKYEFYPSRSEAGTIFLPTDYVFGEAVVIPRSHRLDNGEDFSDNVYLGLFAINTVTQESHWIVYDGRSMSAEPVVRIRIPKKRVPLGFHGAWIEEKELQGHFSYHRTS